MRNHILAAHKILTEIYSQGKYSNLAFVGDDASDMTVKIVYGTLENETRAQYILSQLISKKPQRAVETLLKIGVYCLENLTDVPKFAIVSESVEVAKLLGKGANSGFVNAVLKKVSGGDYKLPKEGEKNYLSVAYSKPEWFVKKICEQYPNEDALKILSAKSDYLEHIRVREGSDVDKIIQKITASGEKCVKSELNGIIAKASKATSDLFRRGEITYQSPSSMLAVRALLPNDNDSILDLCSAPGGKAVYIAELAPNSSIIACDLHPHRVELIKKYKERMHVSNIREVRADAAVLKSEWTAKFDKVLVDAPCSCFGTFLKHPDVFLSRGEDDIKALAKTQRSILETASKYVKVGGTLLYSTCTLFDEENKCVVNLLLESGNFELLPIEGMGNILGGKYKDNNGMVQIIPDGIYDGFFLAKLRKIR